MDEAIGRLIRTKMASLQLRFFFVPPPLTVKALDPTHSYTPLPTQIQEEEKEKKKNETTMSSLTRPFTRRSALTSSHFLTSTLALSTSRPFHKANILSALSESDHGRREFPHLSPSFPGLSQKGTSESRRLRLSPFHVLKQSS